MDNEQLFMGLFQRLHGSGLHPVLSGELAAANYPTDARRPLRAVRCREEAVHWHTEAYLDQGTATLEETWLSIWGLPPHTYLGVASGSPAAREYGLTDTGAASTPATSDAPPAPSDDPRAAPSATPSASAPPTAGELPAPPEARAIADLVKRLDVAGLHERFSSSALPADAAPMARYFADIMCLIAQSFPSTADEIRKGNKLLGYHRSAPSGWYSDLLGVGVAQAIYRLTATIGSDLLVTGVTGDYYRSTLATVDADLARFAMPVVESGFGEPSSLTIAGIVIERSAARHGVRLTKTEFDLWPVVLAGYVGGQTFADSLTSSGSFGVKLRLGEALAKVPKGHGTITQPEDADDDYVKWVAYCVGIAQRRRIPRRLIEDLLPTAAAEADWTRLRPSEYLAMLESDYPGRSEWLRREGVTANDIETFWSKPRWVLEFIEALVSRHVAIEVDAHVKLGETDDEARNATGAFVPVYGSAPYPPGEEGVFVPFELFERVEPYWAVLDDENLNRRLVEERWLTAATRIRAEIAAGNL